MKQAVIFALEAGIDEPDYEKMAILLVRSIRDFNPDIDIYCGIFTNRVPDQTTLNSLQAMGVEIYIDKQFYVEPDSINYFLRNYCCHWFGNYLLDEYDQLIYLDIDVLVLHELDIPYFSGVWVQPVPDYIKSFERPYIGEVEGNLYYNWFTNINSQNVHVWDIDYSNTYMKESDRLVSQRIDACGITTEKYIFGAYYPDTELKDSTRLFHYDGFIDSGTFYKLQEHRPDLYRRYKIYAEQVMGIKLNNDAHFWEKVLVSN